MKLHRIEKKFWSPQKGEGSTAVTVDPQTKQKGEYRLMEWLPVIGYALVLVYYLHHNLMG